MNTKTNFSFKEKARNSVATSSTSTSSMANDGGGGGIGGGGGGGGESDSTSTGGNVILLKRSSDLASSSASSTTAMLAASAKAKNYFKTQLKLDSANRHTDSTYGSATSTTQETGELLKSNSFMTSTQGSHGNEAGHIDAKPPALQQPIASTTKKSSFLNVKLTSGVTTVKKNSNENLRSSMNRSTQQPKSQIASSSASGIQMRGSAASAYEKSSSAQIRSSMAAKKPTEEPVVFVSSLSSSSSYNSTSHSGGSSTNTNISGINKPGGLLAPPQTAPQQQPSTLLRKEILLIPSDKLDDLISKSINRAMKSNDADQAATSNGQIVDQMASFIDELKDFIDDRLIDTTSQLELSNRHMYHLYKSVNYLIKEVSHLKLQNEELKQELFILNSHTVPGSPKFNKKAANFYETIMKRGGSASNRKERAYVTSDAINNSGSTTTAASGSDAATIGGGGVNRSHTSFVNRDHQKSSENSIESTCSTSGTNGTASTAASHCHSEERQHIANQTWHKADTNGNYYENLYKPRNLDWRLISSNKKLTTNPTNTTSTTAAGSPSSSMITNPILATSPMLNFLTSSEMEINEDLIGGRAGVGVGPDDDKYISIEENLDDEKVSKLLLGDLDYLKTSFSHNHHHLLHPTTNTTNNNSNSDNSNLNCNNDSCSNATTNSDEKADDDSSSLHEDEHNHHLRRILPLACESSTNTNHSSAQNNTINVNNGTCPSSSSSSSNSQNLSRQEKMLNSNSKVLHHLHTSILPFTNLINDFDAQYSWDYTDNNNI